MQQLAQAVSRMGGAVANGHANGALRNGTVSNGVLPNGVGNGYLSSNKVSGFSLNYFMVKVRQIRDTKFFNLLSFFVVFLHD